MLNYTVELGAQKCSKKYDQLFLGRSTVDIPAEVANHRGVESSIVFDSKNKAKLFIPDDHNEKINQLVD